MSTQVATQQPKSTSIASFLNAPGTAKFLAETLAEKKAEFVSNLIALCDSDSNLQQCEHGTLMKCAMNATALNLPLNKNLGYAYVIAYKGIPSFQIGYKGLIQLAIRTGMYKYIHSTEIRENEIKRNKITGEITFIGENESGKIVGYMAYLELTTGFTASVYMSEAQLEEHAVRFSQMYKADKQYSSRKSKWSDPDARPAMCKKTVLKALLGTYGLMTTEFEKALAVEVENGSDNSEPFKYTEAEVIPQTDTVEVSEIKTVKI